MILIQASKFSFFRNRTKLTDQPCNFISNKHHFTLTSPQNEFTHYQQLFGWIQSFKFKIFQLNWLKPAGLSTRKFIHTFQKEEEKTFGYSTKQIVFSSHTIVYVFNFIYRRTVLIQTISFLNTVELQKFGFFFR